MKSSTILIVIIAVAMLSIVGLVGYWAGYTSNSNRISDLQVQLSTIQEEIISLQTKTGIINQNQTDFLAEIDVLQVQL